MAEEFYSELYQKAQITKQEQENFLNKYQKQISNNSHPRLTTSFEEKELFEALKVRKKTNLQVKMEFLWNFTSPFGP